MGDKKPSQLDTGERAQSFTEVQTTKNVPKNGFPILKTPTTKQRLKEGSNLNNNFNNKQNQFYLLISERLIFLKIFI